MTLCLCDGGPTKYFWPRAPQSHNTALVIEVILLFLSYSKTCKHYPSYAVATSKSVCPSVCISV